ncbi:beta strand repeat-containing protein [Methylobacterium sp. Leaf118]|uniref:beta strand repeat-containing protein n=1 Tax=Methylobacterium sp. Leaf118 TaxID=2876562 RepID=UPI001E481025|nr:calcium-binding protein [Methylobacterium sp. Leaf118]
MGGNDSLTAISPTKYYNGNSYISFGDNDFPYGGGSLYGGEGNDVLSGGAGNDFLRGDAGIDVLNGGVGNDTLEEGDAGSSLDGGDGDDQLQIGYQYRAVGTGLTARGGTGNDTIIGGSGTDILDGGAGDDTLQINGTDLTATTITNIEHLRVASGVVLTAAQLNGFTDVGSAFGSRGDVTVTTAGTIGANFLAAFGGSLATSSGADTVTLGHSTVQWSITTGAGNDTVTSGAGVDILYGGEGNDVLSGGAGNDFLRGDAGIDVLTGGVGNDTLEEGDAGSSLDGGDGDDQLQIGYQYRAVGTGLTARGGTGNDTIIGGSGTDILDGEAGDDTLQINGTDLTATTITNIEHLRVASGVVLTAAQLNGFTDVGSAFGSRGDVTVTTAGTIGANFLAAFGGSLATSSGADTVTLSHATANWSITAGAGNDTVTTGAGNDSLNGGEGLDRLDGGAGADTMQGDGGNDTYIVDHAGDRVFESSPQDDYDSVYASVSWSLAAGQTVEALYAAARGITLKGNELSNSLHSDGGGNRLEGGAGNDHYYVVDAADQIIEAADGGFDVIYAAGDWTLTEGSNVEGLAGDTGAIARRLTGNSANNVLFGGDGIDILTGRKGDDSYLVNRAEDRVIEAKGEGRDDVQTLVSYALAAGQEIEFLSTNDDFGTDAINLTGNEFAQTITGNDGHNILNGRGGADTLVGYLGNDTYIIDNAADRVVEMAGEGRDTIVTSVSYRLAMGQQIEVLQTADSKGTAALTLTGNEFANTLVGNAGNNVLDGGVGSDEMIGGAGNDTYIVDNAGDRVVEAAGGGRDAVAVGVNYTLAAGQEIEELRVLSSAGDRAISLTGNEFAQTIRGNDGANRVDGGAGADTLIGGAGSDTYIVDNAGDQIVESKGGGWDSVATGVSYTLAAGQEIEELRVLSSAGDRAIDLTGNSLNQTLIGNSGANVLNGGWGNDVLTGRGGADTFVFANGPGTGNIDRITDFASEDTIQLSKSIFTTLATGELDPTAFKNISVSSVDASDRILYKQSTGELFYDADGSGSGAKVKVAVLDNKAALTAVDFLIV